MLISSKEAMLRSLRLREPLVTTVTRNTVSIETVSTPESDSKQ